MKKILAITAIILIAGCASKPKPKPADFDWDYIFETEENFGDNCGREYSADCVYYPPYYQ